MKNALLLTLALTGPALVSAPALAQDLDEPAEDDSSRRDRSRPEVKEVVRGFYAKANVGAAAYLLDFNGYVNAGTAVALAVGQDFVDQSNTSMAWELALYQGIHNGMHYEVQADAAAAGQAVPYVQGDLRTYSVLATLEWSTYPSRRFGIGVRGGGGLMFSPLLMDPTRYQEDVLGDEWGLSGDPGYHGVPHPVAQFGPTLEYYTKLSHFSVGADADVFYAIGFDLGVNATGYLKYTF